ncbi:TonB-dependent receptor plug domain-containing protein [Morganella morganii]|nr:TonB-dependent receptor plug domain-containing protein [Morganella morganii]
MLPEFMQRIDVLKGPASVLYGQSNPGGVVTMTSKRPQMNPLREIRLQAGNHHLWQTGFDLSDALNDEETQAYRLTGTLHDQHQQQQGGAGTVLCFTGFLSLAAG